MKRFLFALVVAMPAASATPLHIHGDIVQTITSTNNPDYKVGQKFLGSYHYWSETVDGTFFTKTYFGPPIGNSSLTGYINLPFGKSAPFPSSPGWDVLLSPNVNQLQVSNGQVASFDWTFFAGPYYGFFSATSFTAITAAEWPANPNDFAIITSGSVTFSPPVVPENGGTLWLTLAGLSLCCLKRRRS